MHTKYIFLHCYDVGYHLDGYFFTFLKPGVFSFL